MCGILGAIYAHSQQNIIQIEPALAIIEHRGPDHTAHVVEQVANQQVMLGHKRLSIIDVSNTLSHQPFEYKHFTLIFNGEIYNYASIKTELLALGHQFVTASDTEVLIHAFEAWGMACVERFRGMFAFAILDKIEQKLYLCRDRVGVKPLYYALQDNMLCFASELKALVKLGLVQKEICPEAMVDFFSFGYVSEPRSIFKNIFKLKAGHYLCYDLQKNTSEITQYWDALPYFKKPKLDLSYPEAKEELKGILSESFQLRMVADVPVGVFLSGGYDSSLVTAMLQQNSSQKLKTYSIGFEDPKFNEAPHARKIANLLGTEHHEHIFTAQDAKALIPQMSFYYDEPFSDVSMFPTLFLCQFASQHVTVALSADGGDEVFAGYDNYRRASQYYQKYKKLKNIPFASQIIGAYANGLGEQQERRKYNLKGLSRILKDYHSVNFLELLSQRTDSDVIKQLVKAPNNYQSTFQTLEKNHKISQLGEIDAMCYADIKAYMSNDILFKVDRASMAVSIESREPLIDHKIIEFAAQLPQEYKFHQGQQKRILKDICHDFIPKEIMDRPKAGFSIPLFDWLRGDLKPYAEHYLSDDLNRKINLLDLDLVAKVRQYFFAGENVYTDLAWQIISFNQWYERWMME